jgi:hypothetical protein
MDFLSIREKCQLVLGVFSAVLVKKGVEKCMICFLTG